MCSFSALTLLVGSFAPQKSVPDMTNNVFGGTLSLTQSINHLQFLIDRLGQNAVECPSAAVSMISINCNELNAALC